MVQRFTSVSAVFEVSARLLLLLCSLCAFAAAQPLLINVPPVDGPGTEWPIPTPEQAGMDAGSLDDLVAFGTANDVGSMVITGHGRLVQKAYFGDFTAD